MRTAWLAAILAVGLLTPAYAVKFTRPRVTPQKRMTVVSKAKPAKRAIVKPAKKKTVQPAKAKRVKITVRKIERK